MPVVLSVLRWAKNRLFTSVAAAPVTTALALSLVVSTVVAHLAPQHIRVAIDQQMLLRPGGLHERPWSLVTCLLWPSSPADSWVTVGAVVTFATLLVCGLAAERVLGHLRYVLTGFAAHVLGSIVAELFAWAVGPIFPEWSRRIMDASFAGPAVAVVAAAVCATAVLPRLWRRRIRLTGITTLVTMGLYHGGAMSVMVLSAALVGLFLGRSVPRARDVRPLGSTHEHRVLVSLVVASAGVGPLVGAWMGFADGPLAVLGAVIARPMPGGLGVINAGCVAGSRDRECAILAVAVDPNPGIVLLTCVPTLLLLVCVLGLRRGRRLAWVIALVVELLMAGFFVASFLNYLEAPGSSPWSDSSEIVVSEAVLAVMPALAPTLVVLVLLFSRRLFRLPGQPGSLRRLFLWTAGSVLGGLSFYVVVGLSVPDQWTGTPARDLILEAPRRIVPLEYLLPTDDAFPRAMPIGPVSMVLYSSVGVVIWALILVAAVRALGHAPALQEDAVHAREVLFRYGGGSLAWMGLWEGNRHWFSQDGCSYVPYRLIGGIAVTTGDLVGPEAGREQALSQFLAHADGQGWTACFYSATEELRVRTAARGWQSTQVAEEAVLILPELAFTGKKFQAVRTALNHARRGEMVTTWTTWRDVPLDVRLQIREISQAWVGEQVLPEMGFTLGGLAELTDPEVRLFLLADREGVIHGCASWLPIHREGRLVGWTLDFMRRRPDGFRHTMDVLIGQAALDLKAEGFEELSLSGAPLAKVTADASRRPEGFPKAVDAVLERVGRQLEPVYGFRSLLRFKAKFQPVYRPLYLLYPDPAALPAIGTAIARAYLPDASWGELCQVGGLWRRRCRE